MFGVSGAHLRIKGKGNMSTYFLLRRQGEVPEAAQTRSLLGFAAGFLGFALGAGRLLGRLGGRSFYVQCTIH